MSQIGNMPRMLILVLTLIVVLTCCSLSSAEERGTEVPSFKRVSDALKWIEEEQPENLNLGVTKFGPTDLLKIRQALPEGAEFSFQADFRGQVYNPGTESFNANGSKQQISRKELEALLELMPGLKDMDVSRHRELSNKIMPEIVDAHPQVHFTWLIMLPYSHSLSSGFTAYSTMNHLGDPCFNESSLDILKYAPDMRALDMGHNHLNDVSFLRYMPKLELLILADNRIEDLTPIGELKELRYCEIFMNRFSDLSPLSGCTKLLDLNIARTNVTSLDGLEGCTKLERLWAPQRRQVDEASIERFIEAHPDCEIAWTTGDSTGLGWRNHWRYNHYVACFKAREWIPFEEAEPEK